MLTTTTNTRIALVTGGAGFIGSHLVERLIADGYRVRVLDNLSRGSRTNLALAPAAELLVGDILDDDALHRAMRGVDVVFHLAALTSVAESMSDPAPYFSVCGAGTARVLHAAAAAGVKRVVYAASSSCYGDAGRLPIDEHMPWLPASPYASAKILGEQMCVAAHEAGELETVRLRFFNVYGPRQDPKSAYAGAITAFVDAMANGRSPHIYGDGLQSRDFIFVADVVDALVRAATVNGISGRVFNIGTGQRSSLLEVLCKVGFAFGIDPKPRFLPARAGDVRHSCADTREAERALGFVAKTDLLSGLRLLRAPQRQAA